MHDCISRHIRCITYSEEVISAGFRTDCDLILEKKQIDQGSGKILKYRHRITMNWILYGIARLQYRTAPLCVYQVRDILYVLDTYKAFRNRSRGEGGVISRDYCKLFRSIQ
jgi:hypothetical protein